MNFTPTDIDADPDIRPRVVSGLIVDEIGSGEVVLLHPREARWALTNGAGLRRARAMEGARSVAEIARETVEEFPDLPFSRALADLRGFLRQLRECNLLANCPLDAAPSPGPAKPPGLTLYPTEECNLRCKHCAVVEGTAPRPSLSTERIRELIVEHTTRYENPTVSFMGGEPLLSPDVPDLIEFACGRTASVHLGTNGLLIDESLSRRLGSLPVNVQVSLEGPDPETHDFIRGKGSFDKAWSAVELLCRFGRPERVSIAVALTRCGLPHVRRLIEMAAGRGLGAIRFLPLNRLRAARTHWDRISPDPEVLKAAVRYLIFDAQNEVGEGGIRVGGSFPGYAPNADPSGAAWCSMGNTAVVNSQGSIYNCPIHNEPEYVIGRVGEMSLEEARTGKVNRELRERMLSRRDRIEECRRCPWRNFCQAGCQAFTASHSGSIWINDEFCDFRRELYRENVRRRVG